MEPQSLNARDLASMYYDSLDFQLLYFYIVSILTEILSFQIVSDLSLGSYET